METFRFKQKRVLAIFQRLKKAYPGLKCALHFSDAWQLLVATILSAQCTDKRVNMVTPRLFEKYPNMKAYAEASPDEFQKDIHSTGFYRNKTKNILAAAKMILERFGGKVPCCMDELVLIPGVGRKTANVILGYAFGKPGISVDTHMIRINRLLKLTSNEDPVKIEYDLMKLLPEKYWTPYSSLIIHHGRVRCFARRPDCVHCEILRLCPYGSKAILMQ